MPMRRSILIVKCGSTQRGVAAKFGDYETWFIRALGGDPTHFTVVSPQKSEPFPDPARCAAVIATGSPSSVLERRSWMAETGEYLLRCAAAGVPVLGVCFSHQLLGDVLGAPVQHSPRGREFGTVDVDLTPEGQRHPLFKGIPQHATFQAMHEDEVAALPDGAILLAGNTHSPIQAFQLGPSIFGVQFHPELWLESIRAIAAERRLEPQHYRAEEAPAGHTLLKNFHEHYIAPRED
jgi:GMP synthase (glutamine-hydrolysing)